MDISLLVDHQQEAGVIAKWYLAEWGPLEHRGKGVSSKLIIEAISRTNDMGVTSLYLRCEVHNVALYEKFGFASLMTQK